MFAEDISLFESNGSFGPFPTIESNEFRVAVGGGVIETVMDDGNVRVEATRVFHGTEVVNAYAYRFTLKGSGKRIVFSGDTAAPNGNLINMAAGCDILVHEAQDNQAIAELSKNLPKGADDAFRKHMYESHSNVLDLPGVAQQARARTLVLSHYAPVVHDPETWLRMVRPAATEVGYTGEIIAPRDLETIPVGN